MTAEGGLFNEAFLKGLAQSLLDAMKKEGMPVKDLYTIEEACELLACSREQIRNFTNSGRLPVVTIDRRPRYRLRDLDRFIEEAKGPGVIG